MRARELRLRRARVALRALIVHLHLGDVRRREIARLQPPLGRCECAGEELRVLRQCQRSFLRQFEIEIGTLQRGELLAQHVEVILVRRALQARGGIKAKVALVAPLERLVDAKDGVRLDV